MTRATILKIKLLCFEFIRLSVDVVDEMGESKSIIAGTKKSGELRRLSMELSRKLAELRAGE